MHGQITWLCLLSYICTLYKGHSHLQGHVFSRGLEIRIRVIFFKFKGNDIDVEFRLCNLWSLVWSPVMEVTIYTADET